MATGSPLTSIEELLTKTRTLPHLSGSVAKLLSLNPSDSNFFDDACEVIQGDPALTADVIRLANSSQFAGQAPAMSVERAFMRVGSKMIASTIMESHLLRVFNAKDPAIARLWCMSTLSAHLAQQLARERMTIGVEPDEAYSFGLLHDVGYLVLVALFPVKAWDLLRKRIFPSRALLQLERELLGVTHTVAGALLASRWHLPANMAAVIGSHHKQEATADVPEAVSRALGLIGVVDDLVYLWAYSPGGLTPRESDLKTALSSLDRQILYKSLGVTVPMLAAALDAAVKAVEDKRVAFGIPRLEPLELDAEG